MALGHWAHGHCLQWVCHACPAQGWPATRRLATALVCSLTACRAGRPHLLQCVVGGVVEGVRGAGSRAEGKHLLLLLVQQLLHVPDHDLIAEAVGLQEDFDSLHTGEGHSDIDGGARLGRAPPEVQLGTRTGMVTRSRSYRQDSRLRRSQPGRGNAAAIATGSGMGLGCEGCPRVLDQGQCSGGESLEAEQRECGAAQRRGQP